MHNKWKEKRKKRLKEEEEKRKENYDKLVKEIRASINIGIRRNPADSKDWLCEIYSRYVDRFAADNERIWIIANIFIPLSLAGLTTLKEISFGLTVLLAIASIILIWFWLIAAENHRAFQQKSEAIINAIELSAGFDISLRGKAKLNPHKLVEKFSVQKLRHLIFWFVIIIWVLATFLAALKAYGNTPIPCRWTNKNRIEYLTSFLTRNEK